MCGHAGEGEDECGSGVIIIHNAGISHVRTQYDFLNVIYTCRIRANAPCNYVYTLSACL